MRQDTVAQLEADMCVMCVLTLFVSSPGKTHEAGHCEEADGRQQLTISWIVERGGESFGWQVYWGREA